MIKKVVSSVTLSISLHISKISNVSSHSLGASMSVSKRIVVRARSSASLKKVSILMNVEAVLLSWSEACELSIDLAKSRSASLAEMHNTLGDLIGL